MTPLIRRVVRLSCPSSAIMARRIGLQHPSLIGRYTPFRRYKFGNAPPGQKFFHRPTQALRKLTARVPGSRHPRTSPDIRRRFHPDAHGNALRQPHPCEDRVDEASPPLPGVAFETTMPRATLSTCPCSTLP